MDKLSQSPIRSTLLPTPDIIKKLILITCIASIGCVLFDSLFGLVFEGLNLENLFSLSLEAYHHYYLWQILTYMFVQNSGGWGLSFGFVLFLAFNMYILWSIGSGLVEQVGAKSFLRFYFTVGVLAGISTLIALIYMPENRFLSGPSPSILDLLIVWCMLYPETEFLFFFLFPLKAKWLAGLILALVIVIPLSHQDYVNVVFNLAGIFWGYCYAVFAWEFHSPLAVTNYLDLFLHKCGRAFQLKNFRAWQFTKKMDNTTKIYDFKTGEPVLSDDDFVDAMLAKISRQGEQSLTYPERKRLNEISQKKNRKKS
jgi:membrane associated rhomboid family serine protease